jgi:hypothetical protein
MKYFGLTERSKSVLDRHGLKYHCGHVDGMTTLVFLGRLTGNPQLLRLRLPHRESQDRNRGKVDRPPDVLRQVHRRDRVVEGRDCAEEYHDAIRANAVEPANCNQRGCSTCDKTEPRVITIFVAAIRAN